MTVTVYYWPPHGHQVGHAAVGVKGLMGSCYISWWPADGTKDTRLKQLQSTLVGVAGERYTLEGDIVGEGNRRPLETDLTGLAEADIIAFWRDFKLKNWSLLRTNCAQVAVDALRAGGADKYINTVSGWRDSWQFTYWKPMEVHIFAQHVRSGLYSAKR